jgi:hypothetical protein
VLSGFRTNQNEKVEWKRRSALVIQILKGGCHD